MRASAHLCTDVHRPGAALACAGDDQQLLSLQTYVNLSGRMCGRLSRIKKQTAEEAMLACGDSGRVSKRRESQYTRNRIHS